MNVLDHGADPTGTVKSDQAFAAAIATGARIIDLPAGTYRLEHDLVLDRAVELRGAGGAFRAAATVLRLIGSATIRVTQAGQQSALVDLGIRGDRYGARDALVLATAPVHVSRCYLRDSGKHGIRIDGTAGVGNANGWTLRDVWVENCGEASPGAYGSDGYGVRIDGQDSQGDALGVHVVSSWGGIADSSFLGCVWVACHVEGCPKQGYLSESARSQWLGCYCELDSPASLGSCVVVGGTLAAIARTANKIPAGKTSPLVIDGSEIAPHLVRNVGGGSYVRVFTGTPADGRTALAMQAAEDSYEHGWRAEGGAGSQRWAFERARSALYEALSVTRVGHALGPDRVIVPKGVVVGTGAAQVTIDAAAWASVLARLAALEAT